MLIVFQPRHTIDAYDIETLQAVREPFAMAMQTERRLHEMAKLRESAEAEKGSLLRRLGRTDLQEAIVGESSGLRDVMKRVMLVVQSDVPVLIMGETGTGKEVIARASVWQMHSHEAPFIRVNCRAIPPELIDSQLFGHGGAACSRHQCWQGWLERADRGTLFSDEIGELPREAQVRFLPCCRTASVERVGAAGPVHVDVRVVAATHHKQVSVGAAA